MGAWGIEPWNNDTAADWFADLMDTGSIREQWHEAITYDPDDDNGEFVLAAAWLFIQLGRVYVWPVATLDEDLELTINALRELLKDERMSEGDPEAWARMIGEYITELEQRRSVFPVWDR